MAIFRSASGEGGAEVVLAAGSPYGSRTLVIERDEDSSVAYLCSPDGTVHGAVWLANHRP
ncbi:suppressor of fused domain protein, partial [Nonomuraea turkmeniaca]